MRSPFSNFLIRRKSLSAPEMSGSPFQRDRAIPAQVPLLIKMDRDDEVKKAEDKKIILFHVEHRVYNPGHIVPRETPEKAIKIFMESAAKCYNTV